MMSACENRGTVYGERVIQGVNVDYRRTMMVECGEDISGGVFLCSQCRPDSQPQAGETTEGAGDA